MLLNRIRTVGDPSFCFESRSSQLTLWANEYTRIDPPLEIYGKGNIVRSLYTEPLGNLFLESFRQFIQYVIFFFIFYLIPSFLQLDLLQKPFILFKDREKRIFLAFSKVQKNFHSYKHFLSGSPFPADVSAEEYGAWQGGKKLVSWHDKENFEIVFFTRIFGKFLGSSCTLQNLSRKNPVPYLISFDFGKDQLVEQILK